MDEINYLLNQQMEYLIPEKIQNNKNHYLL